MKKKKIIIVIFTILLIGIISIFIFNTRHDNKEEIKEETKEQVDSTFTSKEQAEQNIMASFNENVQITFQEETVNFYIYKVITNDETMKVLYDKYTDEIIKEKYQSAKKHIIEEN